MTVRCPNCGHIFISDKDKDDKVSLSVESFLKQQQWHWSSSFEIGIDHIDKQHRQIVTYIGELNKAISMSDLQDNQMRQQVKKLRQYVQEHLRDEEDLLRKNNYQDIDQHLKMHDYFRKKVSEFDEQCSESLISVRLLLQFLVTWFVQHILVADKAYAVELKGRRL
jgi:hemerythrin